MRLAQTSRLCTVLLMLALLVARVSCGPGGWVLSAREGPAANKTQMVAWVDQFLRAATQEQEELERQQRRGGGGGGAAPPSREPPGTQQLSWVQQALEPLLGTCGVTRHVRPQRRNLVVTTAGQDFDASQWMSHYKLRTFELVLINYSGQEVVCKECIRVFNLSGPKWRIVHLMTQTPEWQALVAGGDWDYISFPDDDLGDMDTCTFNKLFQLMRAYGLVIGQPSVCDRQGAFSVYPVVMQHRQCLLHYTNFVEVMAPTFSMDFFQNIVQPTLYNAWSGWGLDFVWVHMLRYPPDKVAVIDEVCMMHFDRGRGEKSMYGSAMLPLPAQEELEARMEEYAGLEPQGAGLPQLKDAWKSTRTLRCLPRPPPPRGSRRSAAVQLVLLVVALLQAGMLLGCLGLVLHRRGGGAGGPNGRARLGGAASPHGLASLLLPSWAGASLAPPRRLAIVRSPAALSK